MLIVGLMSGTSLDGIDAALVRLEGDSVETVTWEMVGWRTEPYPEERRSAIHDAILAGTADALCALHADLGEWSAQAVLGVCERAGIDPAEVDAVGTHGQTIWHRPPSDGRRGATLQLGDPATIAERTGCTVISDFRARDVAAGGEGAPLVPFADHVLFSHPEHPRALQNIGGIGNVTRVPKRGSGEPVTAFDTGPGNALIDAAVELATGGRRTFDLDGVWGRRGEVDQTLLAELLDDPYLRKEPPKSTGREMYGRPFVERIAGQRDLGDEDDCLGLIATLTEFTARSISDAYERWIIPAGVSEAVIAGGGARNPLLMERLVALLDPLPVRDAEEALGIDPEAKEAVAFAVLAWAHLLGIPANEPAATGADGPRVLGSLTPGGEGRGSPLAARDSR